MDLLNQDLKPNFVYSNIEHPKCDNKPKKTVTFDLPPEKKILNTNNEIFIDSGSINIEDFGVSYNDVFETTSPIKNISLVGENTNNLSENTLIQPKDRSVESNAKKMNTTNFECQFNENKIDELQLDFELIEPHEPVKYEFHENKNANSKKVFNEVIVFII